MHALYDLKEMLCKELEDLGQKGEMSPGVLDAADKLAHTIKNLMKIIEDYEDSEYSGADGMTAGRAMMNGTSYARGRGRNARRDSMGRYSSRDGRGYSREGGYSRADAREDLVDRLESMMEEAPGEKERSAIRRAISQIEKA